MSSQPQHELFRLAAANMRDGDPAWALELCLNKDPEDPNMLCLAERSLIALQRFDEARVHVE